MEPCDKFFFEEPRREHQKIFSAPHVLIREKIDGISIPAIFSDENLVFSNQIIGIHAPSLDVKQLRDIAKRINNSAIFGILSILVSPRILVGRQNSLYKNDIMSLPYPSDTKKLDLNFWEEALAEDIMQFQVDFRKNGEESTILLRATDNELSEFGKIYCRILNSVYEHFQPLQPIHSGSFVCFAFSYGAPKEIETISGSDLTANLDALLHRKLGNRLFINRIIRIYEQNVIYMIKPDQKRYWLRSIALRDADETFIDLHEQGY